MYIIPAVNIKISDLRLPPDAEKYVLECIINCSRRPPRDTCDKMAFLVSQVWNGFKWCVGWTEWQVARTHLTRRIVEMRQESGKCQPYQGSEFYNACAASADVLMRQSVEIQRATRSIYDDQAVMQPIKDFTLNRKGE